MILIVNSDDCVQGRRQDLAEWGSKKNSTSGESEKSEREYKREIYNIK